MRQYENEKVTLEESIAVNEGILASTKATLEQTIASYEARIQEGQEALAAINLALEVLRQNQSDLEFREGQADIVEDYVN